MPDGICPFATFIPLKENVSYSKGFVDRVGFCDHTAGGYMGTMKNPDFWNNGKVSAHFAISLTGEIIQLVNIFDTAWCQGRDANGNSVGPSSPGVSWPPFSAMNKQNPNGYLISTEHEDKQQTNLHWPNAMLEADKAVKKWCVEETARVLNKNLLRFGIDSLAGHYMFDFRNRPYCPGTWWRDSGRFLIYNSLVNEEEVEMKRFNAEALPTFWRGLAITAGNSQGMNARSDLGLPNDAERVWLDVWLDSGSVDVLDGSGALAGFVGGAAAMRTVIEVILGNDGFCGFRALPDCKFHLVGCVGYA